MFLDYNVAPFIFETCYHDASGSTTHIANDGTLLEWYRYDLDGTPIIYDGNNNYVLNVSYTPGTVPPPASELYFAIDGCAFY
jgi:hypothetical protein